MTDSQIARAAAGPPEPADRGTQTDRDTRSALIAVARKVFAQEGYNGASIRRITSEAGANLGAVTYHFGSKRQLYVEVLRTVMGPILPRVRGAAAGEGTGLERLVDAVRAFFEHLSENPDQPGLMMQEIAAGRSAPAPVLEVVRETFSTLMGLVEAGQRDGSIRAGSPPLLTLSSVAQPVYFTLARKLAPAIVGPLLDDRARDQVADHVIEFVRRGLAPGAGGAR
jgi:AcrR family transcriptional regulator